MQINALCDNVHIKCTIMFLLISLLFLFHMKL